MAEVIKSEVTVVMTGDEVDALVELLDSQENLDSRLTDLNNELQTSGS